MWLTRVLSSISFLSTITFTIPLSFDVGGRTCGLAFSLSLATFYFFFSVLRLVTPDGSRFRYAVVRLISVLQWLVIPTLMIWSLNKYSVDSENFSSRPDKSLGGPREWIRSPLEGIFGQVGFLDNITIGVWDKTLRYSTPIFQILEGFCSLLVIQAAGQITRWLVNRERGDNWMVHSFATIKQYGLTCARSAFWYFLPQLSRALFTSYGEFPPFRNSTTWTQFWSDRPSRVLFSSAHGESAAGEVILLKVLS